MRRSEVSDVNKEMGEQRVVIVGAGHAGTTAAASLRQLGFNGKITIYSDEVFMPYQRPPLSKSFLLEDGGDEKLRRFGEGFYSSNRISLVTDKAVLAIDKKRQQVLLSDDGVVDYDYLVIATGSMPRKLNVANSDLPGIHYLSNLNNAQRLKKTLGESKSIAIIGGGYIGLEVACSARKLGLEVCVIERQSRLLERAASKEFSEKILSLHSKNKINFLFGAEVSSFSPGKDGIVSSVNLSSGNSIHCDAVLVCIGGVPNDKLAIRAGLPCTNGIEIDSCANVVGEPSIFAVGDVSCRPLNIYETTIRLESIQNAIELAKKAANKIANNSSIEDEVPWFWSDQGDLKIQISGIHSFSERAVVNEGDSSNQLAVYHYRGESLVCVECINSPKDFVLGKKQIKGACWEPAADHSKEVF